MTDTDGKELESPEIIEEIIPGKNNDYNDNQTKNNNNQQSFIENYNEKESAEAVLETAEESKKVQKDTNEPKNQVDHYNQAIADTPKQILGGTITITENYLEFQKHNIDSFQSIFMPYFQNSWNQLWNSQKFYKNVPDIYSKLISNYVDSVIAFSKIWNEIAWTNIGLVKNAASKAP